MSAKLYDLQCSINNALDFTQINIRYRPTIKFGLDAELDAKELRKQDIAKNVTAAAKFALNELPDFLNECSVVHIPEMGHMVAIKEWEPNCDPNRLQDYGFQFVFVVNNLLHYKNPMCVELDKQLGNIHHDILAHENRIIQRLAEFVLRYNKEIREPLKVIALIDCLIAISRVAKDHSYVRPHLNQDNIHEIKNGRHLLLELLGSNNFVPNDYYSGGNYSRMKILTGPNNSGKSVYLKQTALIIFLAHIGSYVPATSANIGIVHSIHSRIHAMESAGVSLSAFMLDLSQMSQALHSAKSSSLIILDEFGRGTTGDDGIALLAGAKSRLISHIKMDHTKYNSEGLVFLYKVVEGLSNSYAFDVAAAAGLNNEIIARARQIYQALFGSTHVELSQNINSADSGEINLSNINIPEPDD